MISLENLKNIDFFVKSDSGRCFSFLTLSMIFPDRPDIRDYNITQYVQNTSIGYDTLSYLDSLESGFS